MYQFSTIFLILLGGYTGVRYWLSLRQRTYVQRHRDAVPYEFQSIVLLDHHQKAADYTLAKGHSERISIIWSAVIMLWWTFGGGLTWLLKTSALMLPDEQWRAIGSVLGWLCISMLLTLPLRVYRTFSIDARYGFNRTTPLLFVRDQLLAVAVTIIVGVPIVWVVYWLYALTGSQWWLWAWAFVTVAQLVGMWVYPVVIAPLFNRFTPLVEGAHLHETQELLQQTGFAHSKVFVMDASRRSTMANAYFTGFGRHKRVVFYDTLLEKLTPAQVTAVLAHEIGHYRHRDIIKIIVASTCMTLFGFAVIAWITAQSWFLPALSIDVGGIVPAFVACAIIAPVFIFWTVPLQSAWSRSIEFAADAYAIAHTSVDALSGALIAIYRDNAGTLTPDPLYAAVYYSHPPIAERIQHMHATAPAEQM